jgi:hypothetical protein
MGLRLNLIIEHPGYQGASALLGYDRLTVACRNHELFGHLEREATPLPEELYEYGDEGLKKTQTDPYGKTLTYLPARTLAAHLGTTKLDPRDKAVLAFLEALPADTRVVLWWH